MGDSCLCFTWLLIERGWNAIIILRSIPSCVLLRRWNSWGWQGQGSWGQGCLSLWEVSTWSPLLCSFIVAELLAYWHWILRVHIPKDCHQAKPYWLLSPSLRNRISHLPKPIDWDIYKVYSGSREETQLKECQCHIVGRCLAIFGKYCLPYLAFSNMCWTADLQAK